MATTPIPILMAITHTPTVIMVLGDTVTGVMADGVTMVLGVRVTGVTVGIADSTFCGQLYYIDVTVPFSTFNEGIGWAEIFGFERVKIRLVGLVLRWTNEGFPN